MQLELDLIERLAVSGTEQGEADRAALLRNAVKSLNSLPPLSGTLAIDLSALQLLDSGILSVLVEVRRKAAEARVSVRLEGLNEKQRLVLMLARLDDSFEIEEPT